MKIFVQVIDKETANCQFGMIDEPAMKGFEVLNAVNHFVSVSGNDVRLDYDGADFKCGKIYNTSKLVTVTIV